MAMNHYILVDGEIRPATWLEWAVWFQDDEARRVASDEIPGEMPDETIKVSTVFLGINHNWGDGPPLLFETMVFGGICDEECRRYATLAAAKAGHAAILAALKTRGMIREH